VRFPGSGTCDSKTHGICRCDAGPPVFSINGDGFAHGPRTIAYSDGKRWEPNSCYGDHRDLTREGDKNMCAAKTWARVLRDGEEWMKIDMNNFPDIHFTLTNADREAGSRIGSFHGERFSGNPAFPIADHGTTVQYSAPTFIPITSSRGSGDSSCAVDECFENHFNGPHVNPSAATAQALFGELHQWAGGGADESAITATTVGPYSAQAGQSIELSAGPLPPDIGVTWDLGDGTVREGGSISHAYRRPGIYPIRLTTEREGSGPATTTTAARIGVAENRPPRIEDMPNIVTGAGRAVELVADVDDEETRVAQAFWNFGDGELGEGERTTHTWSEAGTYTVAFSATDDEGATSTTALYVSVGTPAAPSPIAPVMAGTGSLPLFSWEAVEGTNSYTVRVISEASGGLTQTTVDVSSSCGASSCRISLDESLAVGNHAWTVTATNEHGEGPPSEWARFRVQNVRNNPPTVSVEAKADCTSTCAVTFSAFTHDSDSEALSTSWSGCGSGTDATLQCTATQPGTTTATVTVTDPRGSSNTAVGSSSIYAASYAVGEWGPCSAGCGGGTQTRTVVVSSLTSTAPGAVPPRSSKACNTQKCGLTCYDYTNMFPRKELCYNAGWRVCEKRYRPSGIGGTLSCWKGFK
jgi:hypothetical protein